MTSKNKKRETSKKRMLNSLYNDKIRKGTEKIFRGKTLKKSSPKHKNNNIIKNEIKKYFEINVIRLAVTSMRIISCILEILIAFYLIYILNVLIRETPPEFPELLHKCYFKLVFIVIIIAHMRNLAKEEFPEFYSKVESIFARIINFIHDSIASFLIFLEEKRDKFLHKNNNDINIILVL